MSLDKFWQTARQSLRRVGKIRKQITIPVFSEQCGPNSTGCLYHLDSENVPMYVDSVDFVVTSAVTVELVLKPKSAMPSGYSQGLFRLYASNDLVNYVLAAELNSNNQVVVSIKTTEVDTEYTTVGSVTLEEWNYITVVYSQTDETLWIFLNGFRDTYISGDVTGSLAVDPEAEYRFQLGGPVTAGVEGTLGYGAPFYVSRMSFWNIARPEVDVYKSYNKYIAANTTLNPGLKVLWKFNEGAGLTVTDYVGTSDMLFDAAAAEWITDDAATFFFGTAFVIGEFDITAAVPFSIVPTTMPEAANFGLTVRWLDDDGETVHRYWLWQADPDVVDSISRFSVPTFLGAITPITGIQEGFTIADYNGEVIPATSAVFEIWNIDGERTVDLEVAKIIITSVMVVQSSPTATSRDVLATLTLNTDIAEPFPLIGFPLLFDQPQTFD